jgi:glycosyltransferase involved in cell wall biosynthesis
MPLPTMGTIAPLVSVVIATYNRFDSLLWLLNDLRTQKPFDGDIEVIVVDDGSARAVEPELIVREYPFPLRIVTQGNAGPAAARHAGILVATGRLIVIVDDDMVLPETFLAAHVVAHAAGADVVMGHIRGPEDRSSLSLFERFHQYSLDRFVAAHRAGQLRLDGGRLCTGNVSFLRQAYFDVGGFDRSLGRLEDRELGIRFEAAGHSLVFSEDAWNEHRSDHEDASTWRRRSRLYGELDVVIAARHRQNPDVSPWAFLPQLPKPTWPFAVLAASIPAVGRLGAGLAYQAGEQLDHRGRPAWALHGAALSYFLDYFSGVGTALGAPHAVVASLRAWRRLRESSVAR